MCRREWDPQSAQEWTVEDLIACILSALSYTGIMIGFSLLFLGQLSGLIITIITALITWLMFWIIDPKLRAVSEDYEKRQKEYIEMLDRLVRWEDKG